MDTNWDGSLAKGNGCGSRCWSRNRTSRVRSLPYRSPLSPLTPHPSYSHENPTAMSDEQFSEVLDHTYAQLTAFSGRFPVSYVAPWWEMSSTGIKILLEKGIQYSHSSQAHDCQPFYVRDEVSQQGRVSLLRGYRRQSSRWVRRECEG